MAAQPVWTPLVGAGRQVALEVLIHGPLSRSELATRLRLSPASLTRLTKPLIESGLLVEGRAVSDGDIGRPSQPLDIDPDSRYFVGVKLTGGLAYGVVTTLRSRVIHSEIQPIEDTSPEAVVEQVAGIIDRLAAEVPEATAAGVSVGGKVLADGSVASAAYLGWTDVPLQRMLEERTGRRIVVENDIVSWTEAEHWFGAGRDCHSFALLTIGAGVGFGLVMHDQIVRSEDSGVGLLGHFRLDPLGPLCAEGHRGCATAMLTNDAICAAAAVGLGRPVTFDECLDLAESGDPVASRVIADSGRALGRMVAAVANVTQVEKVVLSGEGVRLAHVASTSMTEGIEADRSPWASPVVVCVDESGFIDWARGSAVMAIQRYVLSTP